VNPPTASIRSLSTAEERREDVLRSAMKVVGERGLYGTPTTEIARAAGISQAYLFRLFPTKVDLFVAVLERSFERVHDTLLEAARQARRDGADVKRAMGEAYTEMLRDPEVLLTQLQGQAAAGEPAVRDALRRGFARLFAMVEREWGGSPQEIQSFFAHGMLCNVIAAMQIDDLQEHWAEVLSLAGPDPDPGADADTGPGPDTETVADTSTGEGG
jgi:AcrR family transcriptional regulator